MALIRKFFDTQNADVNSVWATNNSQSNTTKLTRVATRYANIPSSGYIIAQHNPGDDVGIAYYCLDDDTPDKSRDIFNSQQPGVCIHLDTPGRVAHVSIQITATANNPVPSVNFDDATSANHYVQSFGFVFVGSGEGEILPALVNGSYRYGILVSTITGKVGPYWWNGDLNFEAVDPSASAIGEVNGGNARVMLEMTRSQIQILSSDTTNPDATKSTLLSQPITVDIPSGVRLSPAVFACPLRATNADATWSTFRTWAIQS